MHIKVQDISILLSIQLELWLHSTLRANSVPSPLTPWHNPCGQLSYMRGPWAKARDYQKKQHATWVCCGQEMTSFSCLMSVSCTSCFLFSATIMHFQTANGKISVIFTSSSFYLVILVSFSSFSSSFLLTPSFLFWQLTNSESGALPSQGLLKW